MFFAGGKITFVLYNLETVTPTNNKNVKKKRESIDKRESVNKEVSTLNFCEKCYIISDRYKKN